MRRDLVHVTRDGRPVVRIAQEPTPDAKAAESADDASAWEASVAALPVAEQVEAVARRLKERNPGFDGAVTPTIRDGVVTGLKLTGDHVADISPVRSLTRLRRLDVYQRPDKRLETRGFRVETQLVCSSRPREEFVS